MRKIKIVVILALAVVLAVSCKSKSEVYSKPETVMEKFVTAFVTADFETMYKFSVPRDAALIRNIQKYMRNNPERLKQMNAFKVEIQETTCKYYNDTTALCKCKYLCDKQKKTAEFKVKKQGDKWLVDMAED